MASLVYKVTPVPAALRDFVFDFGGLPPHREAEYINQVPFFFLVILDFFVVVAPVP